MTQNKLQRGASLCRTILQGGLQEEKNDNKIEPTMQEITNTQNSFFKGIKYGKFILLKQAVLISKFSGGGWGDWKKKKTCHERSKKLATESCCLSFRIITIILHDISPKAYIKVMISAVKPLSRNLSFAFLLESGRWLPGTIFMEKKKK